MKAILVLRLERKKFIFFKRERDRDLSLANVPQRAVPSVIYEMSS